METMAKVEFSRRELELLISGAFSAIREQEKLIEQNPYNHELTRDCARDAECLKNLVETLTRARETVLPMSCPA